MRCGRSAALPVRERPPARRAARRRQLRPRAALRLRAVPADGDRAVAAPRRSDDVLRRLSLEAEALVHAYWRCLDPSLSAEALAATEARRAGLTSALYSDVTATAAMCASPTRRRSAASSQRARSSVGATCCAPASSPRARRAPRWAPPSCSSPPPSLTRRRSRQRRRKRSSASEPPSSSRRPSAAPPRCVRRPRSSSSTLRSSAWRRSACSAAAATRSSRRRPPHLTSASAAGRASRPTTLPASLQHYGVPTDGAQLVSLVHNHRLSLATVAVLLFFLLVMNLALVVGMRWLHADRRWSAQYAGYGAVMASD